ncbi:DUF2332 family protein [Nocardioides sp. CBS4Y-1]|uniref:DUF2332 family protein n=2 Tax=Nocardioides acrostichi TaxID=2784339 RepID=A0A930V1A4_9ACTN|nr:DUF2332 family protein [Nocardioides acrostichi]
MVEHLRLQAIGCHELGSPMYADLLLRVADDVRAGGPAATVLAGHEDDPGPSALGLRLMGGVHALVLAREAGALAAHCPSVGRARPTRGGAGRPRPVVAASCSPVHGRALRRQAAMRRAPKTPVAPAMRHPHAMVSHHGQPHRSRRSMVITTPSMTGSESQKRSQNDASCFARGG